MHAFTIVMKVINCTLSIWRLLMQLSKRCDNSALLLSVLSAYITYAMILNRLKLTLIIERLFFMLKRVSALWVCIYQSVVFRYCNRIFGL